MYSPNDEGSHPATLWSNPYAGGDYVLKVDLSVSQIDFGGGYVIFTNTLDQGQQGSNPRNTYWSAGVALRNGSGPPGAILSNGATNHFEFTVRGGNVSYTVNGMAAGSGPLGYGDDYFGILGAEAIVTIANVELCPL